MGKHRSIAAFHSSLAPLMEQFVEEKRACGYQYDEPTRILGRFDHFLSDAGLTGPAFPSALTQQWLSKRAHESARTHHQRITVVRQFAKFLCRLGSPAYVPDATLTTREHAHFAPRILTLQEMRQLLQAVEHLVPTARSPLRHLTMPEIFRLLYGCGFRLGEVAHLRVREVDLDQGILTVRQGKWRKDRLVPPAPSLVKRLRKYAAHFGHRPPEAFFFPAPNGGPYGLRTVYGLFRPLLLECGIPHAGRGQGPRVHDLRHTLAVHTRMRWYREGAELDAKLPLLATYLGHQHLSGTQRYLQLPAELFPDLMARANAAFGEVMPRRVQS